MSKAETPGIMPDRSRSSVVLQRGRRSPLRQAAQPANPPKTRVINDRRRFQRVNIKLLGRFMRENKQEYPCQVVNMSAGGLAVKAPIVGEIGERIVIYLDTFGRIEGEIVRIYPEGFALRMIASSYKREKIANQLTWLLNKDRLALADVRQHERIVPNKTKAKLTLPDGTAYDCQVLDVSLGGAAVVVEPKPDVGQLVFLGLIPGHIIRHGDHGISIKFVEIQNPATIERQFG